MLLQKSEFVGIENVVHLCAGGEAPLLKTHQDAIQRFFMDKAKGESGRAREDETCRRCKEKVAQLMGVNTGSVRIRAFILIGLISAFAGVLYSFHIAYFWPSTGEGYLLNTLASVFLGGTSVFGGTGTILGTFLGAFIIGAIEAATVAIGLTGFWTQLIYGLIIVLSVIMHTYLRKRME